MKALEIANHISNWLEEYRKRSGTGGFVVGISGGIDSAVTSTLCAQTGAPTLLVEMPIHQSQNQVSRGRAHIQMLTEKFANVRHTEVDLTQLYDEFAAVSPSIADQERLNLTLANTRARFRMTTLYYLAGINGYLVAGTGNKVEDFGVGFYTKYGDGGVDVSPIADLNKTEVYALGKVLGVNKEILSAPPTDGLWGDDRTDEDQIGASYPELEWAMEFNGDETELSTRQKEVLDIYRRLHRANKHKMEPIPVCQIPEELKG